MNALLNETTTWSWTIGCKELQGKVHIKLETSCPWRPKQSKIVLYKGSQPSNPNDNTVWKKWWAPGEPMEYNTEQDWGSGWSAALIAKNGNNSEDGEYYYVAKSKLTVAKSTANVK